MIKGVNRQMVEVRETGSEYFERILFIVKPEFSGVKDSKLREQASKITNSAGAPPVTKRKKLKILSAAKLTAAAGAGAAITALVSFIK